MSDPDATKSPRGQEKTHKILRRIAELLDRERLGLIDDPPGRRTIYAHRNSDSLWHFWDKAEEQRIPIEKQAVRGLVTDVFTYVKTSTEGESTKVRVQMQCADAEYEIETSLNATSGRGLMSGLLEAGNAVAEEPITIGVRPADKEQVLFVDVYTDSGGLQINGNHIGAGDEEAALNAVRSVRTHLDLDPDPWSDRFDDYGSANQQPNGQQGPPPRGQSADSASKDATGDPEFSGTHQRHSNGAAPTGDGAREYDRTSPPTPEKGTEHGQISRDTATQLWNAAKAGGYEKDTFMTMLREEFGIEDGPQFLHVDDFERAWQFACDKERWEEQRQTFEPDDELPF